MVSKRSDIIDPSLAITAKVGLAYSEVLGWIDLGHACGNDIKNLLQQMAIGENGTDSYYDVLYSQTMYKFNFRLGAGKFVRWRVKRGTSLTVRKTIMLAMMMRTALKFEHLQASLPFAWTTDSGFSAEDLVSDLLGFYRVIRPMNYFPYLKLISKEEAIKRWDHYGPIGNFKNKVFRPLLFPDPTTNKTVQPVYGALPRFMMSIQPYNNFSSDTVLVTTNNGSFINIGLEPPEKFK